MNDQFILSGSSDTTIKLWDLRTFKVYKNFDIHDDSVWSLYSQSTSHDSFKTFILVIRVVILLKLIYQEFQFSILEPLTMMNLGLIIMKTTILMRNWVYRL